MSRRLLRWRALLPVLFCLTLALAPSLADARAGSSFHSSGSSFGSRGSRSFEHNGGAPLARSAQPTPSAGAFGGAATGGSFFQRHPFLTGIAGGFFGAWLFGGGPYADAVAGAALLRRRPQREHERVVGEGRRE